jgi:hypothetical protein
MSLINWRSTAIPLTSKPIFRASFRRAAASLLPLLLVGCQSSSGPLSNDNVQKALDQLITKCNCRISGTATVVAVKENADGAVADVQFKYFMDNTNDFYRAPWNGIGKGEIHRYADGRYALTKVTWGPEHTCTGTAPL